MLLEIGSTVTSASALELWCVSSGCLVRAYAVGAYAVAGEVSSGVAEGMGGGWPTLGALPSCAGAGSAGSWVGDGRVGVGLAAADCTGAGRSAGRSMAMDGSAAGGVPVALAAMVGDAEAEAVATPVGLAVGVPVGEAVDVGVAMRSRRPGEGAGLSMKGQSSRAGKGVAPFQ